MSTEGGEIRLRYGRSVERVSILIVGMFVALELFLVAACFLGHETAGDWFGDVMMAGIFFLVYGAGFAVFWVKVARKHRGHVILSGAGIKMELGGTTRCVPWDRVETVSNGYRLLVPAPPTLRTIIADPSGAATVKVDEDRYKQDALFALSAISIDPRTIHITVIGESELPIVLNSLMFYHWKADFRAVIEAVARNLPTRFVTPGREPSDDR